MFDKTGIVARSDTRDTSKQHTLLQAFVPHGNIYTS
jgi:hypothetical protein